MKDSQTKKHFFYPPGKNRVIKNHTVIRNFKTTLFTKKQSPKKRIVSFKLAKKILNGKFPRFQNANIRQISVLSVEIHTVTHNELVGNSPTHVFDREFQDVFSFF